jgi:truncated hemoglobin YjbI
MVETKIFDYFYQQMHQDKIVTIFFIKRMPQYLFRQYNCRNTYWGILLIKKIVTVLSWCIFW